MKLRIAIFLLATQLSLVLNAQDTINPVKDTLATISVDPFDHQSKVGQAFYVFLLEFERDGHLGEESGGFANSKRIRSYLSYFNDSATIPDDLSTLKFVQPPVKKDEYAKLAKKHGYLDYSIIVEKRNIEGVRIDSARYRGSYKYFKLYDPKAIIGEAYFHGVMYEMEVEFNLDGSNIMINQIEMLDSGEFHVFKLGKFGYTSDNRLKATNNLWSLIQEPSASAIEKFKPPKDSSLYRVGPSFMFYGSYVQPNYLTPVIYLGNHTPKVPTTESKNGFAAGLKILLPTGKEGNFNFTIGLGYERNNYNLTYEGLEFIYDTDCFGDPLVDFEGMEYDEKRVYVSSAKESGSLTFIQPEFGMLYHINLSTRMRLSLFGSLGYSYLAGSNFESESIVSYQGRKGDFVIEVEELGFYQDRLKTSTGEISNATSFYTGKFGMSLDFSLSKRTWLAFAFDLRAGLSPVFRTGYEFCPFLDVHVNDTFLSTYTNVAEEKYYDGFAITVSYRYQFPKK